MWLFIIFGLGMNDCIFVIYLYGDYVRDYVSKFRTSEDFGVRLTY